MKNRLPERRSWLARRPGRARTGPTRGCPESGRDRKPCGELTMEPLPEYSRFLEKLKRKFRLKGPCWRRPKTEIPVDVSDIWWNPSESGWEMQL